MEASGSTIARARIAAAVVALTASVALLAAAPAVALALGHAPVISQVYGGGESGGATYCYDYIEIHNPAPFAVSVAGWSVQYARFDGTFNNKTDLAGTIPAGGYLLVREGGPGGSGVDLPVTPDVTGGISMAAASAKIALVSSTVLIPSPTSPSVIDFVGYGAANAWEGSAPVPILTPTTAAFRRDGGNQDTNQNSADFVVQAPLPRNSSSPAHALSAPTDIALSGATVLNKQPAGTGVGTLSATDPDSTGPFTYALVAGAGDTDNASFAIAGNGLSTAAVLDYATKSAYSIRVRATDPSGLEYEESFTITVVLPPSGVTLSTPITRRFVRRNWSFEVYGFMNMWHQRRTYPVVLYCYHEEGGAWVLRRSALMRAYDFPRKTKYAGRVRLPIRGRWRLVAEHADAWCLVDQSPPRYVTVR